MLPTYISDRHDGRRTHSQLDERNEDLGLKVTLQVQQGFVVRVLKVARHNSFSLVGALPLRALPSPILRPHQAQGHAEI